MFGKIITKLRKGADRCLVELWLLEPVLKAWAIREYRIQMSVFGFVLFGCNSFNVRPWSLSLTALHPSSLSLTFPDSERAVKNEIGVLCKSVKSEENLFGQFTSNGEF